MSSNLRHFFLFAKTVVIVAIFTITSLFGLFLHGMERGGGWIGGGRVNYIVGYGKAYNWEPGYDSLSGFWKGSFPETKCGTLYLDMFDGETRQETESGQYVSSEHCEFLMSLGGFVDHYSNRITVRDLRVRHAMPGEETQIAMFNELKNQGLLDDVRYKEVRVYDWSNIRDFIHRVIVIPVIVTSFVWFFLKIVGLLWKRRRS